MRREAKLLLVLGSALVLLLELPVTLACLAAAWRGPYAESHPSQPTLAGGGNALRALPSSPVGCMDLMRR